MSACSQKLNLGDSVPCFFVGVTLLGCYGAFTSVTFHGSFLSCAVFSCLSLILYKFRIDRAPSVNVEAVFGNSEERHLTRSERNDTNSSESAGFSSNSKKFDSGGKGSNQITIVGHRGAGLDAPENSLSAFRLCKERGCDFVEFDVACTKDNILVVFHDDDLLRMAGIPTKINEITFAELQKVDISVLHPMKDKFAGERVPTFDETVELLLSLNMRFFIDLKDTNSFVVDGVCESFTKHPEMYKKAVVSSFHPTVIHDIRRRDPNIIGCMAWRPGAVQYKCWSADGKDLKPYFSNGILHGLAYLGNFVYDWLMWRVHWWFLGLSAVLLQKDSISKHELQTWYQRGMQVYLWTVNMPAEKSFFTESVRVGYLTDTLHPDTILPTKVCA